MTPEFRRDPLHNTWVVFSPERQRRPQDYLPAVLQGEDLDPFAEGNERLTPPEVYAIRKEKTKPNEPGWRVRVVPNRYPAMRVEGSLEAAPVGLYDRLTGNLMTGDSLYPGRLSVAEAQIPTFTASAERLLAFVRERGVVHPRDAQAHFGWNKTPQSLLELVAANLVETADST